MACSWGTDGVEYLCRVLGRKAGIPVLHPHVLRHTLAASLLATGVPLTVVSELLGHSAITTIAAYLTPSAADL
jgi:site-specific recombinase XerD